MDYTVEHSQLGLRDSENYAITIVETVTIIITNTNFELRTFITTMHISMQGNMNLSNTIAT